MMTSSSLLWRRGLCVLVFALVFMGALGPGLQASAQSQDAAESSATVASRRARWDKLSPEEQRELRARFERLKGMSEGERAKLAERAKKLAREMAEIESSLEGDEREALAKLDSRERAGVLRKLVADRARQAASHLRSRMTPEERQRVGAAAPGERAKIIRSIREREMARLPEHLTALGRDLGVSSQDLMRVRSGTPKEQLAAIANLLRRRTEKQVREEGLPPGLGEERWAHMKDMRDETFLRVLQRVRQRHPDFGVPKHRREGRMRRGEMMADRLEEMSTPAARDRARFPTLQEPVLNRRAVQARRHRIEDLIVRQAQLEDNIAAKLRAASDREFYGLYSTAIKVLREGGDLPSALERQLNRASKSGKSEAGKKGGQRGDQRGDQRGERKAGHKGAQRSDQRAGDAEARKPRFRR
jgi:hypothetical protein